MKKKLGVMGGLWLLIPACSWSVGSIGNKLPPLWQQLPAAQLGSELTPAEPRANLPVVALSNTKVLGLREAVQVVVKRHPSVLAALSSLAQQGSEVEASRAAYMPRLSASVSNGRLNPNGGGNTQLATLSASQLLYDFGKTSSKVSQSESLAQKQAASLLKQIDTIAQQTADAFVESHRYQQLLVLAQTQLTSIDKVLAISNMRAAAGLSSKADPIQAQTRQQSAQATLLQMQSQLKQNREKLEVLLGGRVPPVIAAFPADMLNSEALKSGHNWEHLPDILVAQADRMAAKAELDSAKAQSWPTISLDLSTNRALSGVNPGNSETRGHYNTAAIMFSSPIYQGNELSAQRRAAAYAVSAAESQVEVARLAADNQSRTLQESISSARNRLQILAQRKSSILQTRELYREQYTLGSRSLLDLLNAEQEVFQAQADEVGVEHDLWQSVVSYFLAVGVSRQMFHLDNMEIQGVKILP
ncbi:TolC family outer membrane protein [Neisseriaceae bacterium TC5R-5]|nr:TolC family outer membrane protein [Neisseriaceae bacterium TC5R-5]